MLKSISLSRPLSFFISFFLHLLLLFPALVVFEFFFTGTSAPFALVCCLLPSFLAYFAAYFAFKRQSFIFFSILFFFLLSCCLSIFFQTLLLGYFSLLWTIVFILLFWSILFFFRSFTFEMSSTRYFLGIFLYMLVSLSIFFHPNDYGIYVPLCNCAALLFAFLGLIELSRFNLLSRLQDGSSSLQAYPTEMFSGNLFLSLLTILLTIILSQMTVLYQWFLWCVNGVMFLLARLVDLILVLTRPIGGVADSTQQMEKGDIPFSSLQLPFLHWIVQILIALSLIALFCLLLFGCLRLFRRFPHHFRFSDFWGQKKKKTASADEPAFLDKRETLLREDFLRSPFRNVRKSIQSLFRRKPSLDPSAPIGEQLRFVYRKFLTHRQEKSLSAMTVHEAFSNQTYAPDKADSATLSSFAAYYDQARYSSEEVKDRQAAELSSKLSNLV